MGKRLTLTTVAQDEVSFEVTRRTVYISTSARSWNQLCACV